jgi:hypothetical protein
VDSVPVSSQSRGVVLYEYEAFKMLTKVRKTAAGVHKLSYWLFHECADSLISFLNLFLCHP